MQTKKNIVFFLLTTALLLWRPVTGQQVQLLKDINPGPAHGNPYHFTEYNGKLYFGAGDDVHGWADLWVTDGTAPSTYLVKDINPNSQYPANADNFKVYNGKLYFSADDGVHGLELWVSDGTQSGTYMLKDINTSGNEDFHSPHAFTVFDNRMFFTAWDGIHGYEPWVTDGTAAGTYMLKDINPGIPLIGVGGGYEYNGKLYFAADDGVHGTELWATDGTTTGTQMLKDINPGIENSLLGGIIEYNGKLYFSASNGSGLYNWELWVTDGTKVGTYLVKDINPGPEGSTPTQMTLYNGKLYFGVDNNASNYRVWTSDGTAAGTQPLAVPGIYGPQWFTEYNNKLYFSADSEHNGRVLWVTDGTVAGTSIFATIPYPSDFTLFDGKLFMVSNNEVMWVTDGTQAGTHSIVPPNADLPPPQWDPQFFIHSLKVYNDALYFRGCYYSNIGCETYFISKSLSVEQLESKAFTYWPNPFRDKLHLQAKAPIKSVEIYSVNGRKIASYNPNTTKKTLKFPHLPKGVYFMEISIGNTNKLIKLIKQ